MCVFRRRSSTRIEESVVPNRAPTLTTTTQLDLGLSSGLEEQMVCEEVNDTNGIEREGERSH